MSEIIDRPAHPPYLAVIREALCPRAIFQNVSRVFNKRRAVSTRAARFLNANVVIGTRARFVDVSAQNTF